MDIESGQSKDVESPAQETDDSSEESMDDDENDKNMIEVERLSKQIEDTPFNYQLHVEKISLLRKCGEFDQLVSARNKMAEIFPLTQELWLNWLEDEQKCAETDEEHEKVTSLFECAVQDYMCPEIWLEYAQYSIRYIGKEGGFEKVRKVLNEAIAAVGLHVRKGASIWEAYREIENAILVSIQPPPGSTTNQQQNDLINDQTTRITSLFSRQLAIPLLDMEDTFDEYVEWRTSLGEKGEVPNNVKDLYNKALAKLEELKSFEVDLENKDIPSLETYRKYIEFEKQTNDPARVQCIYERAVAEHCLNADLWSDYIAYLNKTLKSGPIVTSVCSRSVRNCPWGSSLWQTYLLALERTQSAYDKLERSYKAATQVGFSSPGDYAYLFQTWCDISRRRYCNGTDRDELGRLLRAAFETCTNYLLDNVLTAFRTTGDPDYTLWCYWARCEAEYLNNMSKARQIIDHLMEDDADARRNWKIWRDYYEIERLHGDLDHCRSVLRRAVQSCAADDGGAEMACEHYVRFEREKGSLEDLDDAMRKVDGRLAKVKKRKDKTVHQMQERTKKWEQNGPTNKKWRKNEKKPERPTKKRPSPNQDAVKDFGSPQKRVKSGPTTSDRDFKAPSSLPPRFSKPTTSKPHDSAKPTASIAPPPGFQADRQSTSGTSIQELTNNPDKKSTEISGQDERTPESEARTVFLSNLGFDVESIEEKLKQIFSRCGSVTSIRLVKSNKGNFRGYAYVEFEEKSAVEEALKLDREPLEGRPIYVSPNVDKSKHPDFKVFKYSKGMEKQKLFVSGLSFDTTEGTIRQIFSQHGPIKSLRVVTTRSGKSKGLAYVEFEKEADATQALLKTDQIVVDGFTIKVAISNPPPRIRSMQGPSKSLGSGGNLQAVGGRGRGRTQVALLPRSLQKSAPAPAQTSGSVGKPMSNKDFAQLLLKK